LFACNYSHPVLPTVTHQTIEPKLAPPAAALTDAEVGTIILGIMLAMFLSALEQTIVAPALPAIGRSLSDVENLSWVVTAYLLSATAATPLFGKLSDIYGRRAIMLIGIGIFIAGSFACALAPAMWMLILARALQGLGGGGILPIAQTIIADLLTPRERPRYQAYSSVMFMSASILGPTLGGLLTDHLHWSLIFWINIPLGGAALFITDRALRRLPRNHRPHKLDLIGAGLMVGAAVALLFALAWGGTYYPWSSPNIFGLIGCSAALWMLFVIRLVTAPEPFIPLSIMREKVAGAIMVVGFFSIGTVIGLSIFVPLYLQLVLGFSASVAGAALIAFMAGATIGSMITGRLIAQLTHYRRVPLGGLAISIVALAVMAIKPAALPLATVVALVAGAGGGVGSMYPVTTVLIQNVVPPHQFGTATGALNFFRLLGGAIIVAVFGAIVLGGHGAAGGISALEELASAARHPAAEFDSIFRWVFLTAAFFLAVAFIAMVMVEERPLRGPADAPAGSPPRARPTAAE
jgi:EmrB/QacA subfamily drug resistance transporter